MLEFGADGYMQNLLLGLRNFYFSYIQSILIFSMVMMCERNDFTIY